MTDALIVPLICTIQGLHSISLEQQLLGRQLQPLLKSCCPPEGPSCSEGLSGVGYLSVFHLPPLISWESPVPRHTEPTKPSQGKTKLKKKNKPWILPQQQCEVFMET